MRDIEVEQLLERMRGVLRKCLDHDPEKIIKQWITGSENDSEAVDFFIDIVRKEYPQFNEILDRLLVLK